MGSDKALLAWPPAGPLSTGQTFLSAAISALSPFTDLVIVVVGANEPNLAPIIYANGASSVRNPTPELGQFSSLQCGLHEVLNRGRDAAMVTLVDRPPASPSTLQKLTTAFEAAISSDKWAVVPEYKGTHGHPIVIGREMMEAFLRAPATANAREIEHRYQDHVDYLSVDDPFVAMNVDTPQDYEKLSSAVIS
jgi:molybdenum cofactor cytidylyltransferase